MSTSVHSAGDLALVEVSGLTKTYATRVVDDVTLRIRPHRIHALLGGNGSGKSTVLKMLAGVVVADPGGTISVGGEPHPSERFTPAMAHAAGLRFVHQDLGLIDEMSIADNIALGTGFPRRAAGISRRELHDRTVAALRLVNRRISPWTPVSALRPSDRTLIAIARALSDAPPGVHLTLVLDEPTATLPMTEAGRLMTALRSFRDAGHGVVYVSHRLSEVLGIADEVTVLRDGRIAGHGEIAEFDENSILALMAGDRARGIQTRSRERENPVADDAPVIFRASDVVAGPLHSVAIDVRAGEIVGVAGLVGSGRSSLLRAIFGDLPATGVAELDGRAYELGDSRRAVSSGVAFLPEDRRRDAAFAERPVWENLSAVVLKRYRRWSGLDTRHERADARDLVKTYGVRAPSVEAHFGSLSGGNQQKVVIARWLQSQPRLILLDEPTQGVDAVARAEIHALLRTHVHEQHAGAIVVSSDFDELVSLCDRVFVLQDGWVGRILTGDSLHATPVAQLTQTRLQRKDIS